MYIKRLFACVTVCLSLLILFPLQSESQVTGYGIKLGIQSADVEGAHFDGGNRYLGYGLYLFTDVDIPPLLSTTFDLGYTQRGFSREQTQIDGQGKVVGTSTAYSRLDYVSLAPIITFRGSYWSLRPYFGVGPRLDYLVNRRTGTFNFEGFAPITDTTAGEFDTVVFGFSITAGITDLSIWGTRIRVGLKYEWDITDSLSDYAQTAKNNAIMLTAGINFSRTRN